MERTGTERDRRVVLVTLTPAGVETVDRLFPRQLERDAGVLAGLDADEIAVLEGLLARMLRTVEAPAL